MEWTGNKFNRKKFFDSVRDSVFRGSLTQEQVDGLNRLLNVWENHFIEWPLQELAYNLATSWWETGGRLAPISEYGDRAYFQKYEGREDLGNTEPGDGYRFRGMGDVQNTGRANARKASTALTKYLNREIDLVENPDMRKDPIISALSLFLGNHQGWWTGRKLPDYVSPEKWNAKEARTVVNGYDRWQEISNSAVQFLEALRLAAFQPDKPKPETPSLEYVVAVVESIRDLIKHKEQVMNEVPTKEWWKSKTLIGSTVSLIAALLYAVTEIQLDESIQAQIVEIIIVALGGGGGILSIIGRLVARTVLK